MTVVVDASIILRLLTNRTSDEGLRQRLAVPRAVHAPHLIDAEVASAIRGLLLGGKLGLPRATEMLADFAALRIRRYSMHPYLDRIVELRSNLTAYDACYIVLSEVLRMPLLTQDLKFSKATGHHAELQVYT